MVVAGCDNRCITSITPALIRRHRFDAADNQRLAHLCGPMDSHLRRIAATLQVQLQRRGQYFRIEGDRLAVGRCLTLLDRLYDQAHVPIDDETLQWMLLDIQGGATLDSGAAADPSTRVRDGMRVADLVPEVVLGVPPDVTLDAAAPIMLRTRHTDLRGRTPNQMAYLRQILTHDISFGIGPAGTGKTFLAVACAVDALERQGVQRIVLTRPAVEAGERLGFLPGDLAQKVDPYLRPLYDALHDLMGLEKVTRAFEKRLIEIAPLAFMRGRTLNHAFVILDEAQNTTREQMKMFLTRIGYGSRCVVTGDVSQVDLPSGTVSGLLDAQQVLAGVPGIAFTQFNASDVVRHPLVARIVQAYDRAQDRGQDRGQASGAAPHGQAPQRRNQAGASR